MSPESLDRNGLKTEQIRAPGGTHGDRLLWFRIEFGDCRGRCFITTGEAQHLRQLTAEWVARAVANLTEVRGLDEVKLAACSSSGLMLHHSDARDDPF